jgi:hypothetical protein
MNIKAGVAITTLLWLMNSPLYDVVKVSLSSLMNGVLPRTPLSSNPAVARPVTNLPIMYFTRY